MKQSKKAKKYAYVVYYCRYGFPDREVMSAAEFREYKQCPEFYNDVDTWEKIEVAR
jgi:hypothetical protein